MKRVFIGRGVSEAYLVKAYLENAGIAAIVRGEDLSAVFGGIPIDGDSLPSVWVLDEDDAPRALELIEESSRPLDDTSAEASEEPSWECPECHEVVDGTLAVCWNCGAERPPDR